MRWIGLTGGLGTGKSTVAKILREQGFPVLDADDVAKTVVQAGTPGLKLVVKEFGQEYLKADGNLDRQKMARLVFTHPETLLKLESIIHPLVQAEVARLKDVEKSKGSDIVFYDVPLLFEKKLKGFDAVVVVTASPEIQRERLLARNNWSDEEVQRRLRNQVPLPEKIDQADYVIENSGTFDELRQKVSDFLRKLKA
jgi:dephospho-CoA kinase